MKKRNYLKAILNMVLCFTMFISMLYQPVYAIESNDETQNVVNTTAENIEQSVNVYDINPYVYNVEDISHELVDKREGSVKHFEMNDGSVQAFVYTTPVHEQDENGVYQEIDNTLEDNNNNELENTKNDKWKVKFPKKAKKTLVHIHDGNMNIKWGLADFNEDAEVKYLENDEEYNILSNKGVSQTIVYEDILDNVDVQYQVSYKKVKENVVLKNTEAQHVFYYELDTNGYDISIDENNRIVLSKNNKPDYYIDAPFMLDSDGTQHNGITLSLEDKYIKMELDSEWLLDEERVYPVYVDPTIQNHLDKSEIKTTSVYSASPNSTQMYSYGAIWVGKEASSYGKVRGAMKFTLPTLDESDMVVHSSITLSVLKYQGNGVTVYPVMGELLTNTSMANLTWNKMAGNCQNHNDYIAVAKASVGYDFMFDVTRYVRGWYQNDDNYGIGFASENENGDYRYMTFVSSNNTGLDTRFPRASVTYISKDGLEPYLTYQTMNTTSMGTFNVGDFNGNLVYTYNDFSMSGNYLPVGISHVYNHHQRDKVTPVSSNMQYGKGMRLNVNMQVYYNSTDKRYEMIDEDGTTHYFFKEANQDRYQKEFDTDVKLYVNTNDYTIDNKTQRIVFNKNTGFIDKVEDKTNNKIQQYTYNSSNQLTSITDGAGRVTTLEYNTSNQLSKIKYAGNREISYEYTDNRLTKITQSDGNIITFTYKTTDELEAVSNVNEGKVTVEYHDKQLKRVSKITRYGTSNNPGDSFSMDYDLGETIVTDEDGYSISYLFDNSGHTVSAVDSEMNGVYGVYKNTDDNNKHSLNFESKLQSSTINLAINHSPKSNENWTSNQTITLVNTDNEDKAEFTGQAFKLTNSAYLRQQVAYPIEANKSYTVSAYVKINSLSGAGGAYVGVYHGNTLYKSRIYNGTGEWRRISYTFTPTSAVSANNWNIEIGTTNMTGEVLVKNIQLEKGTVANRYNFIENGHFKEAAGTTNISGWSYMSDMDSSTDMLKNESTESLDGTSYFIAYGQVDKAKYLMQEVDIKGKKGDVFVLSGWNKNRSIIQKGLNVNSTVGNTRERSNKIHVYYKGANGEEVGRQDVYFSSSTQNWQYASGSVVAPADYSSVEIRLYYSYQKWYGLFDNIQMYVESFGTTYEHDDKGRVITEQDAEGNIIKTEYMDITITEDDGTTNTIDVVKKHEYKRKDDTNYLKDTVYTYNEKGKVLTEVYTDYNVLETDTSRTVTTEYGYDTNGNLEYTSINGEKKYESGYIQYDSNYVSSYTDERGKVTNYAFNQQNGNINSVTAQGSDNNSTSDDVTTTYTYVGNTSRIASVTTDTSKVNYTYTNLGLVKTISHNTTSDTTDVVYTFNYDEFGNVKDISVGNHQLASYSYGAKNGTLNSTTYKISSTKNETLNYEYDELERVTAIYEGTVKKYSWEYGNEGKIGRFIDHNTDGTIRYSYDLNGNVTEEERSDGTYLYNTYKKDSSLLSKTGYEKGSNTSSTSVSYNPREEVESVTWNTNNSTSLISYTRDFLRRIKTSTYKVGSTDALTTTYNYLEVDKDANVQGNDTTTNVLSSVVNSYTGGSNTYNYTFDDFGNISKIEYGNYENTYEYDKLNQLTRENNEELGKTYTFEYDRGGNLKVAKTYNYTTATSLSGLTPISTETYTYEDTNGWKDLLTKYNGNTITYDNIGNPLTYHDDKTFTWNFRRLEQIKQGSNTYSYSYNQDGIRTSKTVNGVTTNYAVSGNKILQETSTNKTIIYEYDALGNASSFVYNGTRYIYVRNGTNDVVGILNSSGSLVASYTYDGWGNCTVNNISGTIGTINPIRYRSYYYDSETGYYYLNSRYYDSNVGRFINADQMNLVVDSKPTDYYDKNLYSYCDNNPISRQDSRGTAWDAVMDIVFIAGDIASIVANPTNVLGYAELAADLVGLAVPGLTGGGEIVRIVFNSDDAAKALKMADDVIDTAKNIKSNTKIGKEIHRAYDPIKKAAKGKNKLLDKSLKDFGSKLRPDAFDKTNGIIYELKPYNMNSFKKAVTQAKRYADIIGGNPKIVIDLYR